jgi:hypothetical protein
MPEIVPPLVFTSFDIAGGNADTRDVPIVKSTSIQNLMLIFLPLPSKLNRPSQSVVPCVARAPHNGAELL